MIYIRHFIDMDNTIADSQKAFIQTWCIKNKQPFRQEYTSKWDFSDVLPKLSGDEIMEIFISDLYFHLLEPLPNACEVVNNLDDVYIVTMAHPDCVEKKLKWLGKYFPNAKVIPIVSAIHDKSIFNMEGATFIDDRVDMLDESNATHKILFKCGDDCDWQRGWNGMSISNWSEYVGLWI